MTTIAIVGNGTPVPNGQQLAEYNYIIAADGGANFCVMHNIVPHWIIGDGDSLDPEIDTILQDIPHHIDKDQTTTDLQKALHYTRTLTNDADASIDLWCVTSEHRADHTQAAFHALRFDARVRAMYTPDMIIWHCKESWSIKVTVGTALSIIPCTKEAVVNVDGCQWSGGAITLNEDYSGVSNITTEPSVSVSVESGEVYICMDRNIEHTDGN